MSETRMANYPEPITPASTHPTGCIGCKLDAGPHTWTPPTATPSGMLAWYDDPNRLTLLGYANREVVVCEDHRRELMAALKLLSLGCTGTPARDAKECQRCLTM